MIAFLAIYVATIAREWAAWLAALLGLVSLLEFYWKPILPRITPAWKMRLAIVLVLVAQASAYKSLHDRTGSNRKLVDRVSDFIQEAVQLKARYRVVAPHVYDAADPQPAEAWEARVCEYLTKARDRSLCIRFNNRLPALRNPENQRRDILEAAIDARLERLEQIQLDLSKP